MPVAEEAQRFMRRHLLKTAVFWGVICTHKPDYTASYTRRQQPIGRAMALANNRRPLTAEVEFHFQASPRESFGGRSGNGINFSLGTSVLRGP
jgi:hypothetical protein